MCKEQLTIFLADDDPDDQILLQEALIAIDPTVQITLFSDGKQVINYLDEQSTHPCLIVLDYNMPRYNGLQVLEKIVSDERLKHVPTIIWSTSNSSTHKAECLNTGAIDYIVKPNESRALLQIATQMVQVCKGAA
jgi:CheY-like chemotaxis protein